MPALVPNSLSSTMSPGFHLAGIEQGQLHLFDPLKMYAPVSKTRPSFSVVHKASFLPQAMAFCWSEKVLCDVSKALNHLTLKLGELNKWVRIHIQLKASWKQNSNPRTLTAVLEMGIANSFSQRYTGFRLFLNITGLVGRKNFFLKSRQHDWRDPLSSSPCKHSAHRDVWDQQINARVTKWTVV